MPVKEMTRKRHVGARRVPAAPVGRSGEPPLRGREAEVAVLGDRLAALVDGKGGVLVIEGPPGSGRTRLIAEVRARAEAAGLPCLRGSATLDRLQVPFGPLLEALCAGPAPLLDAAAPSTVRVADLRSWTLREARARLAAAAARGPLVVCLDDVQWCDPMTLEALAALLDDLAEAPILWVLSVGPVPDEAAAPVTALCRSGAGDGHRIVLGPLAEPAVAAMAADLLQAEPGLSVLNVARRAQGAPRLIVELLQGLRDEGRVTVRDGVASTDGKALPRRLRTLVRGRLDQMSQAARQSVQVASVLDQTFTVAELAGLTGIPADEFAAVAEEAVGAGFLTGAGDLLGFRHELIRQAISETLPAALRRCLRRQAVDVHLAQGGSAVDVAADLAESAVPGDRRAVALLREAAAHLAATAPGEALALNRKALELTGPDGPHAAEIVAETAELLWRDGRYAEAREKADAALGGFLTAEAEARLRWVMARLVGHASSAEAVRQCRIGLALPGVPEELRDRLTAAEALHLSRAGDAARSIAAAGKVAEGTAGAAGATVLAALARAELARLNPGRALAFQDAAEARAAREKAPRALEDCGRAFTLTASGRIKEALRETDAGLRAAKEAGHRAAVALWSMSRARVLLDAGLLADARAAAETALARAGDLGSGDFADTTARYALNRAVALLGDQDGVRRRAADGARMMAAEAPAVRRTGAWLAALAADAEGETARMAELIQRAWEGSGAPGMTPDPADLVVLTRLALRAGLPALAAEAADRAGALDPGSPFLCGLADHARGLLTDDPDLLRHAVALLDDAERPLVRASAAEDAGRVLGAHGDPAARKLLGTALDLYEESGAARDAARVRRRLRALGVRRPARALVGAAEGKWGLTAAEFKVAVLVAQGATNRQVADRLFLSQHTVSSHLRHIFTKWSITSRVDLTRLVLEHEAA
ncbi:regulatory LuxR family protein [Actinocorallia herbida]|uniref:Regulatory LuxR family protein n=1 Tax=Actinocorallia herbida TaxID=58109 RepID=A0A3N1CYC4_9ACTN|nr:LuxR family transcriptional regulator [Actinocorallia herbida]ROO86297.1 regulatory LuxR family protein [Actinocorallia herbida]